MLQFMYCSNKRVGIPVYQRNYDWKTENCKQLYDDLIRLVTDGRKSHFFGSVVSAYNPDGNKEEYLVIDGQQRLTTVSLLLLAIYNLLKQEVITSSSSNLGQMIFEEYLVDKGAQDETRIKLKPVKNDQAAFGKLFNTADQHINTSNLTSNYNYFYERIQKQEVSVDKLFAAIRCLEIINITLNANDDPQLIFESLNSTGLDLSEGDKVRNYILMGLQTKEQEEYYEKYWNPIEVYTKYNVSPFVRDYLSVKNQTISQQSRIYADFKEYVRSSNIQAEPLLMELLAYAKRYNKLLAGNTGDKALDACILRLNRLETTVTRPFFLEVLRLYDEGGLPLDHVRDIFLIAESYLFRRTICDVPTNTLNKTFLVLHREVLRYDGTADNYLEKFKYAFVSKKDRQRFPDDQEFGEAFSRKQVYLMNNKHRVYLLERLENYGTAEDKDVYRHCDDGTYSIEHIMPQHLTPTWQRELGENYQEIHETWLHRVANLTLTAYNSKYSNSSFMDKRTMENGFDDSGIRMNTWISRKDKWTLEEIAERSDYLKGRALTIWSLPATTFEPARKEQESHTLGDETNLTGRYIASYSFKNTTQPVESWAEMYQKVLQILYAEDKTIITNLALSNDSGLALHFSTRQEDYLKCLEIGDGIYVWTNTSTQSKLNTLRKVFNLYNADPEDLVFYLHDMNEE